MSHTCEHSTSLRRARLAVTCVPRPPHPISATCTLSLAPRTWPSAGKPSADAAKPLFKNILRLMAFMRPKSYHHTPALTTLMLAFFAGRTEASRRCSAFAKNGGAGKSGRENSPRSG
ncbi:MAG: hypothetical protein CM1200mP29_04750 [Verrucomicrobiota bacterium]|nr:MAG: hypothetical protein CM1200mP29_04750 [Verrucomicrobiota bacterium]